LQQLEHGRFLFGLGGGMIFHVSASMGCWAAPGRCERRGGTV
jgi:hypothetical protein